MAPADREWPSASTARARPRRRNGRSGSPEPLGPAETRCPSHGPGSTSAGRPGPLSQVTSTGDVTPSPSGTPCPRQTHICLPLLHLETQPWAPAAPVPLRAAERSLSWLEGCECGQSGRGEAQTDVAGTPHAMEWGPSTHTHPTSPYRVLNVSHRAPWLSWVRPAPQGISHRHTTTSPPTAQPGHRPPHSSSTQHPRLALGSVRPQGWSWLRSFPAPESIQGQEEKQQEGQEPQAAGTDPCCLGREGWGAHPRMNPAPPDPALSPPGVTQDKTDPDEPHRGLEPGAGRCQRCGQRSPGGHCLSGMSSGCPQDRHLPRAAGQPDPQATTARLRCAIPGEG